MSVQWSDTRAWGKAWLNPSPDNPHFLKQSEPVLTLFLAYLAHAERVRDVELMRPLGFTRRRKKLSGPFKRSDLTMAFIAARVAGLQSALVDTGIAEEVTRLAKLSKNYEALDAIDNVKSELEYLSGRSRKLSSISRFFDSDRSRDAVALGYPLKVVKQQGETAMASVTNLPLGFNASDGD